MPSDLIGVSIYERGKEAFVFHAGPVFAHVLLADEINRAGPKTQSALLEAMEEHQVTVEGQTRPCRRRSSSSPRRTRPTRSAPTRCPSRSSTAS
jgi:MoxR-like ATPase